LATTGYKHPPCTRHLESYAQTVFARSRTESRAYDRDCRISMFDGNHSERDEGRRSAPWGERLRGTGLRERRPGQEEVCEDAAHDNGSRSDDQDAQEDDARGLRPASSRQRHIEPSGSMSFLLIEISRPLR